MWISGNVPKNDTMSSILYRRLLNKLCYGFISLYRKHFILTVWTHVAKFLFPRASQFKGFGNPPTGKGYSPHPYCQDTLRFTVFSLCKKCIIGMIQKFDHWTQAPDASAVIRYACKALKCPRIDFLDFQSIIMPIFIHWGKNDDLSHLFSSLLFSFLFHVANYLKASPVKQQFCK